MCPVIFYVFPTITGRFHILMEFEFRRITHIHIGFVALDPRQRCSDCPRYDDTCLAAH
jgi:hypothetical protein